MWIKGPVIIENDTIREKMWRGSLVEIRKYNSDDIKQFTDLMPDLGYPSSLDEMKVRMERIILNVVDS
nr:hypothetical protein [Bacillus sp. 491mf]